MSKFLLIVLVSAVTTFANAPTRIASTKPLPKASGCLKYDVTGKSDLRNDPCAKQTGYQ